MDTSPGTLYIVATPIGNLGDVSTRVLETLRTVDLVAAEDTRRARQLLAHFGLHKPLESFHGDSDERKTERLVRHLAAGRSVAYVSDGGTPGLSDPGRELVVAAVAAGTAVVPVPGPCALVAALSVSGLVADRFVFGGFPPRKPGERREFLARLRATGYTVALYEAPHRVGETLLAVAEVFGDPPVVVARELTKQFEELLRGPATVVAAQLAAQGARGEFVIVVEGRPAEAAPATSAAQVEMAVAQMVRGGLGARDTAEVVAGLGLLPRRQAYQMALAVRKEEQSGPEK